MAEFVQVMNDWRRMCDFMGKSHGDDCCKLCPLNGCLAVWEADDSIDYTEIEEKVMAWVAEHPEPVYPTWLEYVKTYETGEPKSDSDFVYWMGKTSIPADIAQKLGIEPKNNS